MELYLIFFGCEIENFTVICNLIKKYGEFVRIWLGPELNVIVSDPKDVEVNCKNKKKFETKTKHLFVRCCLLRSHIYYG